MTDKRPNLFTRDDTFFGVCQGLGEDLGISPDLIRVSFLPLMYFYPVETVAIYLALGLVVLVTHWLIRDPAVPARAPGVGEVPVVAGHRQIEEEPLPLAA